MHCEVRIILMRSLRRILPPERTMNLSWSELATDVPKNCDTSGRRASLCALREYPRNNNARKEHARWFDKWEVIVKAIFIINVLMDAVHFDARPLCRLHLHGTNAWLEGTNAQISQCSLVKVGPPIAVPLHFGQHVGCSWIDCLIHTREGCSCE